MLPWKMNQKSYKNCFYFSFSCRMWAVAGEESKDAIDFFSKLSNTVEARWRLTLESDIFILTKTLVMNKLYALLESREYWWGWKFNEWFWHWVQDTFLITPEANLHIVPSDNQSKKKEKNKNKKKNYGRRPKKWKLPSKKSVTSYQKYNPI